MGLIDFVKSAGSVIFGGKAEVETAPESPVRSVEESRKLIDQRRAEALLNAVKKLGLEADNLAIRVQGDTAILEGKTSSQAMREKIVLAVGNTNGIAQVDDRLEVVAAEPEAVYYTVKSGDSLSKIAKNHYGNANKYMVIFEANKPMLSHPDKIYPGQVLRIPPQ